MFLSIKILFLPLWAEYRLAPIGTMKSQWLRFTEHLLDVRYMLNASKESSLSLHPPSGTGLAHEKTETQMLITFSRSLRLYIRGRAES